MPPGGEGGEASLAGAAWPAESGPSPEDESATSPGPAPDEERLFRAGPVSEAFAGKNLQQRRRLGLKPTNQEPGPVMVELNLLHAKGLLGAAGCFKELYARVAKHPVASLQPIANTYFRCFLSVEDVFRLSRLDQQREPSQRCIYRIWPDFPVETMVDRSVSTVKADAAHRSYDALGSDIVWAVVDSGVDRLHPHFQTYDTLGGAVAELHWDFTAPGEPATSPAGIASACADALGHGSHVAGIIAGALRKPGLAPADPRVWAAQMIAVNPLSRRAAASAM